jgi:hypothetical protein
MSRYELDVTHKDTVAAYVYIYVWVKRNWNELN